MPRTTAPIADHRKAAAVELSRSLDHVSKLVVRLQDAMTRLEGDAHDVGADYAHVGTAHHVAEVLVGLLEGLEDPGTPEQPNPCSPTPATPTAAVAHRRSRRAHLEAERIGQALFGR